MSEERRILARVLARFRDALATTVEEIQAAIEELAPKRIEEFKTAKEIFEEEAATEKQIEYIKALQSRLGLLFKIPEDLTKKQASVMIESLKEKLRKK